MALSRAERCLALLLRLLSRACLALLALLPPPRPVPGPARAAPPRSVPPPRHRLLLLSARRLAELLRARQVTCIEVVEAYVERIKEVNPLINAVVKDRFEEALQEARQVDQLLSEGPGDDSLEEKFPLLGVPITVKEAFSLYGMPNTSGLVNRRNVVAASDATVVSRLKQAGAIPLGVTNCSELCMWYESSNRVYGRTNNPYDLQRIVGGSSGGEGCVLAAACSVVGVGSDIGGSIRMPAFFNGVFGHKPTTGVVPNDGQFPNAVGVRSSYLCTGPMCRYAEDLEPVLRVMAGPGVSKLKLNEKVSLEKIKFHCMDHDGGSIFVSPVDKEILQAQKKVVEHLESDLGVQVQRVSIHKMKYSFQIWSAMMSSKDSEGQVCQSELTKPSCLALCPMLCLLTCRLGLTPFGMPGQEAQRFTDLLGDHGKPVWPLWELIKWLVGMSSHTLPAIALGLTEKLVNLNLSGKAKLVSMGKSLQEEMEALLGPDGVLLYPSHPTIAPKHHSPICMPFNFAYTAIFNVLGLPVTQCPLGLGSEGLPLGIQLVAAAHNDHLTLAVARYLERAFGGWVLPGKV
ncbi:fatty-acid amide hydrolase 2 isoform X3 [Oenanthe melanoleuca]|uniref:fatty-acid amide hydrolase 2 isoform X3 n=1 Tax=Oenanthe melanoleuca TaxID=2939378 RepID=UPI0024C159F5|nr:fatty-acid amide hydrolase 2 isoform X3 [Oenanthe melanoleuca]